HEGAGAIDLHRCKPLSCRRGKLFAAEKPLEPATAIRCCLPRHQLETGEPGVLDREPAHPSAGVTAAVVYRVIWVRRHSARSAFAACDRYPSTVAASAEWSDQRGCQPRLSRAALEARRNVS